MSKKTKVIRRKFRSLRGRPAKKARDEIGPDLGTPELILKRANRLTAEPIDICLERGFITEDEHRSALHLRWLHTIRYGTPGVTALDLSRTEGKEIIKEDDPFWRACRESEYNEALELLNERGYTHDVIPLVIYNETAPYLKHLTYQGSSKSTKRLEQNQRAATKLSEGLKLLKDHWNRTRFMRNKISEQAEMPN